MSAMLPFLEQSARPSEPPCTVLALHTFASPRSPCVMPSCQGEQVGGRA